jgi:hypothetical protein
MSTENFSILQLSHYDLIKPRHCQPKRSIAPICKKIHGSPVLLEALPSSGSSSLLWWGLLHSIWRLSVMFDAIQYVSLASKHFTFRDQLHLVERRIVFSNHRSMVSSNVHVQLNPWQLSPSVKTGPVHHGCHFWDNLQISPIQKAKH